eukprot:TRINITY_DN46021_c0_g1_i1.p2 TRINITY_DN46021_c0_g1~~TRINITY_DN46021_c0_g1_i1.p2  ORF type:complete len:165 (+),score=42.80 TRINITY_DN46021_c0_g1_i1:91-585(+)
MFAARILRATKMVVGVSVRDTEGSKAAMKKAIRFAQPGDKICAIHVPGIVPEMMLSSMSDPGDASEDTLAALMNMPSKAGATAQQKIKELAESEMKSQGKDVEVEYKVATATSDIKSGLLAACSREKADLLLLGPGHNGKGSFPPFATANANGLTVCVVRDHVK